MDLIETLISRFHSWYLKWEEKKENAFPLEPIKGFPFLFDPLGPTKEEFFWKIIGRINWLMEDDDDKVLPAAERLARNDVPTIIGFQYQLDYKIFQARLKLHPGWVERCRENELVEQAVLYGICGAIALGRDYFLQEMKCEEWGPPKFYFQSLLILPTWAYEIKTGYDDLRYGDIRRPGFPE